MATKEAAIRLASDILACGKNKIWLDPTEGAKFKTAKTRDDIRQLIEENVIVRRPDAVHSRFHARKILKQKEKGRRRGPGRVRGSKNARMPEKDRWVQKIRSIRKGLVELREDNTISPAEKKVYYKQAKGNLFKDLNSLVDNINRKREEERRRKELDEQVDALNA